MNGTLPLVAKAMQVGVVGLGRMGAGIARHLEAAVRVHASGATILADRDAAASLDRAHPSE